MSEQDPIRIFVAHEFHDDADYLRVFEYLESRDNFYYVNTARTTPMPTGGPEALRAALLEQVQAAEIIVVPVPTYERNRDLIQFEIDAARAARKPVLGIQSFGGTIVVPQGLMECADDIVEWNDRTLTDAIRRLARNEATAQWDTIEFKLD